MKQQIKFLVLISAFIITLTIGYIVYSVSSETISKKETATLSGSEFNVLFHSVGNIEEHGCSDSVATMSKDKTVITINVPKLDYIGAYAIIPVYIINNGTMNVRLDSVAEESSNVKGNINISYYGDATEHVILRPQEIVEFFVRVELMNRDENIAASKNFKIDLNYTQVN